MLKDGTQALKPVGSQFDANHWSVIEPLERQAHRGRGGIVIRSRRGSHRIEQLIAPWSLYTNGGFRRLIPVPITFAGTWLCPPRQHHVSASLAADPRPAFCMLLMALMMAVLALTARAKLFKAVLKACFGRYSGQRPS